MSTRGTRAHNERVPTPTEAGWARLRQFRRKAVIWGAKLETEQGVLDCIMLDLSLGGARLRCDCQLALQKPATLVLDKFGRFPSEVVWVTPTEVGVQFNDAPDAVAARFGDVMPLEDKRRK
ncbi:MAG TPA: PilZ domain-containing protein [Stellaceae bacterium]